MLDKISFPTLEYLKFGNIYSGSFNNFNFKIFPDKDIATVAIWQGRYCINSSEIIKNKEFKLDDDGFKSMKRWVSREILNI